LCGKVKQQIRQSA